VLLRMVARWIMDIDVVQSAKKKMAKSGQMSDKGVGR